MTPLAWIGAQTSKIRLGTAIMQLPGRSPANTAMTAMTLDQLSGGRFILGLGTSGPQVVEGWHGVPFDKPLTWLREYITIVKAVLAREKPLEFEGARYQIPYRGPGATGLGKPLKSILHGRKNIPIYTGSMAPQSQAMSAEMCDGLLLTCMHPERFDVIEPNLQEGFDKAGNGKSLATFDVAPTVAVILGDDLDACRAPLKMSLALYIGGMGARDKNFYNEYIRKVGFEREAIEIQDLVPLGEEERGDGQGARRAGRRAPPRGSEGADPRPLPGVEGVEGRHHDHRNRAAGGGAPHRRAGAVLDRPALPGVPYRTSRTAC